MVTKTFNRFLATFTKKPTRYLIFLMIFLVIVCIYTTSLHIEKMDWLRDLLGIEEEEPSTPTLPPNSTTGPNTTNTIQSCRESIEHYNPLTGLCETPTTDAQCVHFPNAKVINPESGGSPCVTATESICALKGKVYDETNKNCRGPLDLRECGGLGFEIMENGRCYNMNQEYCSSKNPPQYRSGWVCVKPRDDSECAEAHEEGWRVKSEYDSTCIPPLTNEYCQSLLYKQFLNTITGECKIPTNDNECRLTFGTNNQGIDSSWDDVVDECYFVPFINKPVLERASTTDLDNGTIQVKWKHLTDNDTIFVKYTLEVEENYFGLENDRILKNNLPDNLLETSFLTDYSPFIRKYEYDFELDGDGRNYEHYSISLQYWSFTFTTEKNDGTGSVDYGAGWLTYENFPNGFRFKVTKTYKILNDTTQTLNTVSSEPMTFHFAGPLDVINWGRCSADNQCIPATPDQTPIKCRNVPIRLSDDSASSLDSIYFLKDRKRCLTREDADWACKSEHGNNSEYFDNARGPLRLANPTITFPLRDACFGRKTDAQRNQDVLDDIIDNITPTPIEVGLGR